MNFYYPFYLLFLPLLILIYFSGKNGIKNFLNRREKLINSNILNKIPYQDKSRIKKISLIIWIFIFGLTIISFARPIGNKERKNVDNMGREIVFAIDISESMKAEDVDLSSSYSNYLQIGDLYSVSRLEAAKIVVKNIVNLLNNDKVSLVAFADSAFPLLPLTTDYELFLSFLNNLDYNFSNSGGTNINNAIEVSLSRFKTFDLQQNSPKIIVIISDGENQVKDLPTDLLKENENVIIHSIGIGSKDGAKIPEGKDIFGNDKYKTYLGNEIVTKLEDSNLKKISKETKGKYFNLGTDNITWEVIEKINEIKPSVNKSDFIYQYKEYFQIPLFIIFILLILDIL